MNVPSPVRVASAWLATAYEPDPAAPAAGEWDRSGPEPRWRQSQEALVAKALHSWKGDPVEMNLHMEDARTSAPLPGSGGGKQLRAQAEALMWELAHKSKPCPRTLYRGSHQEPHGPQAWTTLASYARTWAAKNGGRVFELPKGTRGLRIEDYISSFAEEREWIVVIP